MNLFALNVLLAVLWTSMAARFSLQSFAVGFVLGYVVLWLSRPVIGLPGYFSKPPRALRFALFFAYELVVANLRVAQDVLTPAYRSRPAILALPLGEHSDLSLLLLANMITLTPGTISLDVSDDRKVLYVHAMFAHDPAELKKWMKERLEAPLLELLE